jgi:hypothetical protein
MRTDRVREQPILIKASKIDALLDSIRGSIRIAEFLRGSGLLRFLAFADLTAPLTTVAFANILKTAASQ